MLNDSNSNINIGEAYKTLTVIWFAMLMSQFIFLVVIFFAKSEVYRFDSSKLFGSEGFILLPILGILGIVLFGMSFVFRRNYINQGINTQNIGTLQTGMILGCAFSEAITLFGVVIAFINGSPLFLLWVAFGILGVILSFPKRENLIAASYKRQ